MYSIEYMVKDEHVDFQQVVDGLYYPFYYEWTRHQHMKDVVGVDLEEAAKQGQFYVLTEYTIKFKKPLRKGDRLKVTCELKRSERPSRYLYVQKILVGDTLYSEAVFTCTCVASGVAGVPDAVKAHFV